jgi:hypothetical protein
VRGWRRAPGIGRRRAAADSRCGIDHDFTALPAAEYSYLLGLYLGDGCVSDARRGVWKLRIVLDQKYPAIVDRCSEAISACHAGQEPWQQNLVDQARKQLSIYRKADTARLDEFIGPKSRLVPWPCIERPAS